MRRARPTRTRTGERARSQGDARHGHTLRPPYRVLTGMCRAITHPHAAQHFMCEESEQTMFHYRRAALTLIAAGALALTTIGVPAAFADDADVTQASSPQQGANDSPATIIVQLEAGDAGADHAAYYAQMKKRIGEAVATALPGATISDVRDYHHAFEGFAIQAPASTLGAIKATAGVRGAFLDGSHTFATDDEISGGYRAVAGGDESDAATGAAAQMMRADGLAQKGQGQVIELIDSGIDTSHQAFAGDMDAASLRFTQDTVASVTPQLGAGKGGVWVSPKIPFAYDYGDGDTDVLATEDGGDEARSANHQGTHVAALAAANGGHFSGAAPQAQLIVAKVTKDPGNSASDVNLLAALDDAMVLKPDVVSVSFSKTEGLTDDAEALYSHVYEALGAQGTTVYAPAGDIERYGRADDPDNGALGFPAAFSSTLAVASVNEQEIMGALTFGDRLIGYRPLGRMSKGDGPGFDTLAEGTYRVVYAGNGSSEDLTKHLGSDYGDLSRTILLEELGGNDSRGNSVEVKHKIKALKSLTSKPAGVLLGHWYDTETPVKWSVDRWFNLPMATITTSDRNRLYDAIKASESGSIEVGVSASTILTVPEGIHASTFSSTGVTPDLKLKPEVAAPGGAVMSATPGNYYDRLSGTAEASAQAGAVATLVRQRVASDPAFAGLSAAEKDAVVTKLLMGTARPIVDAEQNDGAFYSPRRVGAGLIDATGATTSFVYPSVVGAENPSRPKADLGDGTSGWTFQVTLTNVSDTAHAYTLGGQALSEKVESMLFTHHSTNWAGQGIDLTFSSDSVTVPAKGAATVTVTVTPREAFASYAAANTPKGTFIDGAVTFTSTDGAPNLTVPYVGFYGSWGAPAIFDLVTPGNHISGYGSTFMSGRLPFGQQSPFDVEDERMINGVNPDLLVISRSTDEDARTAVTPGTVLLRSVPSLTYTFRNEAGETIRSFTCGRADRSIYDVHTRSPRTVEDSAPGCDPWFNGYAPDGTELPDGRYTLTIEASTYGPSPATQAISYSVILDTQAPVISNVTVSGEGKDRVLSFDVTDSSAIAGIGFSATEDGKVVERGAEVYPTGRSEDGLVHIHFDVPLKDALTSIGGDPSTIYLHVWDWPVNGATAPVALTAIPMTSLVLSRESATLGVGETLTLSATHEPTDANVTGVVWSSSDEAVATVSATGEVHAVGAGDATITVSDPTQPSVSASATIHVSAPTPTPKAGTWRWDGRGWWYRYEDGTYPADTTLAIDGATYRFDARGYMRTGWVKEQGSWYYHNASGAQASGWVLDGVSWYYLDPATGVMATGWVKDGDTWYYLNPSTGKMVTGWLKDGGAWYYLKTGSGAMATGRLRIFWTWYTFSETGQLIS